MGTRRRFLKTAGSGMAAYLASPYLSNSLTQSLMMSAFQSAKAQEAGQATKKLITFHLFGAPMRVMFDHFLKTQNSEPFGYNSMVATRFSRGGSEAGGPVYELDTFQRTDGTQLLVPPFWKTGAVTSSGRRNFESLLQNMAIFRGYGTDIDGHPFNASKQLWPLGSVVSLGGLIADQSKTMFPAIQYPYAQMLFKSSGKTSSHTLHHQPNGNPQEANLLRTLYQPFEQHGRALSSISLRSAYSLRMDEIQARLRTAFDSQPETQKYAREFTADAIKKIQKGISGFSDTWVQTFNIYNQIIHTAARELGVYGFTDQPIIKRSANDLKYRLTDPGIGDPQIDLGYNLQESISSWQFIELAQSFALADYLIREDVSHVADLLFGARPRMNLRVSGQTLLRPHDFDEHATGTFMSSFVNSLLFRGLGAGLMELTDRLKQKQLNGQSLFDQTVIQIASEFGRSPRSDGTGSDHGFNAMVSSVISGAIKKGPFVIGNIAQGRSLDTTYAGTWGERAPTSVQGQNVLLSPLHLNSSMTTLLGSSVNPWVNLAPSLLQALNGEIVPASGISEGRII